MIVIWANVIIMEVVRLIKFMYNLNLEFADRLDSGYEKRRK